MLGILQCNLNHCWAAQDLLEQHILDLQVGLCVVAEPIPESIHWFRSEDSRAAIRWSPEVLSDICTLVKKGQHYVIVKCRDFLILSCYIPPNVSLEVFSDFLDEISEALEDLDNRIILCGDFNSKSTLWGSPVTDTRGEHVEEWASVHDLRLMNIGNVPTCVRHQGSSIVDLTWASPSMTSRVSEWVVREDLESLSDHVYITFKIGGSFAPYKRGKLGSRRWN